MPVPERAANEAAQKLRGMLAAGGCMTFTDDYKRQWADRIIKDEMDAFSNQVLNREAVRLEAAAGLIRAEKECRNPNHYLTDGSACEHEIGPSCMAEPSSPSAQAGEKHTLTALEVVTYHPETYVLINEHDGTRWRGKAGEARRGTWVVVEVENREPLA